METKENNIEKKWKGTTGLIVVGKNSDGQPALLIKEESNHMWKTYVIEEFPQEFYAKHDAELFADALNTIQKCDLMPSQLLLENEKLNNANEKLLEGFLAIKRKSHRYIEQRNELLEFAKIFSEAIESEEITIKENFDNDGWENASGRLYSQAKELIKKIKG